MMQNIVSVEIPGKFLTMLFERFYWDLDVIWWELWKDFDGNPENMLMRIFKGFNSVENSILIIILWALMRILKEFRL